MKQAFSLQVCCLISTLLACGCSVVQWSDPLTAARVRNFDGLLQGEQSKTDPKSSSEPQIANPPAKTIRFDGQETVLGISEDSQIDAEQFFARLTDHLSQQKYFTAKQLVERNTDTAESVLWQRWCLEPNAAQIRFIGKILSQNVSADASWTAMLDAAVNNPLAAKKYRTARNAFRSALSSNGSAHGEAEQFRTASQELNQKLAVVDTLHLLAIGESIAQRHVWAESLLLQAIEIAEQNQDTLRVAELWLAVATNGLHAESGSTSPADAWKTAVVKHCEAQIASGRSPNVRFWTSADQHRPEGVAWPNEARQALWSFATKSGCEFKNDAPAELVIWSAIGSAQQSSGNPQLALVNFKKAERFAAGDNTLWLRIAQSECLATLGQIHAAAALLSEPMASENAAVASAANATLGSAKLQAGAFQQGMHLLNKALIESATRTWPKKPSAEADLALAKLIVGETDEGLKSLHAVQQSFLNDKDLVALLQSLENEKRLLELEKKPVELQAVQQRIVQLETSGVSF
ncbi:MAG: hypothetical protein KDB27_23960 [Planctomycetales bacterium]|nr:hypothetical protein [Planctomycetales bacterium]